MFGAAWRGRVRSGKEWFNEFSVSGMVGLGLELLGLVRSGLVRHGMGGRCEVRFGSAVFGSERRCLVG